MIRLKKQLKTEYKEDAKNCIEIYNELKSQDKDGCVWSSKWNALTSVTFKGFPSDERRYSPNNIGKVFLKGLQINKKETK